MGVRSQIVAYCRKQLGCSYSYTPSGGKEGSSYNCSYLSTCAYKAAGLTIPKWQGHQNGDGSQSDWVYRNGHWTTDPSKLKPGDLVFSALAEPTLVMWALSQRLARLPTSSTPRLVGEWPSASCRCPLASSVAGGL